MADQQNPDVSATDATEQDPTPAPIAALEPATLPTHPLRADDVPGLLPKLIG